MVTFEGVWLNSASFGVGNTMKPVKLSLHLVLSPAFSTQRQLRMPGFVAISGNTLRDLVEPKGSFFASLLHGGKFGWSTKVWMNHRAWLLTFHPPFPLQKILKKSWALPFAASFFKCVFFHARNLGLRAFGRALQSHGALFYGFAWCAIQGKGSISSGLGWKNMEVHVTKALSLLGYPKVNVKEFPRASHSNRSELVELALSHQPKVTNEPWHHDYPETWVRSLIFCQCLI